MNISKQGIISASEFSEIPVNPYDTTIYTEPDGSNWIRIFHHNNPANTSNLFSATDDFESFVYKNENVWLSAPLLYFITNEEWEFMVKQKKTSSDTEVKYRWIQSKNPYLAAYSDVTAAKVTYNTSSGYSSSSFGGIYKGTLNKSYFNINNGNTSNWYGAIGCYTAYQGGIPGYPNIMVTSGYIDLYLKVDYLRTNDTASIYQNCMSGMELNEI